MHDLQDAPPINLRLLIESFGLTRAEARVIASKLGVTRQSEVVRMLTRLPQG
jgi:hypothetical protein